MSTTRTTYQNIRTGIAICRLNFSAGQKTTLGISASYPPSLADRKHRVFFFVLQANAICRSEHRSLFGILSGYFVHCVQILFGHGSAVHSLSFVPASDAGFLRSLLRASARSLFFVPLAFFVPLRGTLVPLFSSSIIRHAMPAV